MTEENNRKILHYLKLKKKLSSRKTHHHNISPIFTKRKSLLTSDPFYQLNNYDNLSEIESKTINIKPKTIGNNVKNIEYIYSPRTSYVFKKEEEEQLYHDLCIGFDPMTIKMMKLYFKENLGELNEIEFISILKNYLPGWHPDLVNREKIMVKLLSRLFRNIDIYCNDVINWDNFTEYLTYISSNVNKKKLNYELRMYTKAKKAFENIQQKEYISYAFYIDKYNLIGIIIGNSSIIEFYDADTMKKQKTFIDIKKTQIDIDQIKLKEFDLKAKEMIEKENKKYKSKLLINKENAVYSFSLRNISKIDGNETEKLINESLRKLKRIKTPEKLREEINQINSNSDYIKKKKYFNQNLSILTTCFVRKLDILFISSSNNKISAWKYINNSQFVNVNQLEDDISKLDNTYAIFDSVLPQYTLDYEPNQNRLYGGQADGKILVWEMNKTKNIDYLTLDFHKAKEQKEKYIKATFNNYHSSTEINLHSQITNSSFKSSVTKFDTVEKQDVLYNLGSKMLSNIKKDMNRESVSCIKILGKMQLLAAGYYNGCVILWDTLLHEYRKFYNDQKTGIYQIEYNIIRNLIFTCGFDHNIYIYDPFIDFHCIKKLEGHNYSINSIACNLNNDEFISIDIIGNIKIWDLNNYYNFQTINVNDSINNTEKIYNNHPVVQTKISSNQKMIFLKKANKIFTYGEKLMIFGKESYYFPDICDSQSILGTFYHPGLYLFYVVCLKRVKLWNIFNGRLVRIYENFLKNNSEIISYCTDEMINKLYIGDNFGHIYCMNLNYGNIIKEFIPHKKEIIKLNYLDNKHLLISLSIDNIIKIHCENESKDKEIQREISLDNLEITSINLSAEYSHLIIGTNLGEVKYYDLSLLKFESSNIESDYKKKFKYDSIINIFILDEYPLCFICHESSRNVLDIIPPNPYKYTYFGEFSNLKNFSELNQEKKNSKIISFSFDKINGIAFFGDMLGYVNCYSIKKLLDLFNSGIFNKNQDENISEEKLQILKNYQIEYLYSFRCNTDSIKFLKFFDINPKILITISNDRKVKLFTPKGEFIDEFRQSIEKNKEIPIGIKYYSVDPFISKISSDEVLESNIVYRNDIENYRYKKNRMLLDNLRKKNMSILEYSYKIIEMNSQERLYFISKNCGLPNDRSSHWNYMPDLEFIEKEENVELEIKFEEVKKLEKKYNINNSYEAIYKESYSPKFYVDLNERKVKEFGEKLNQKIKVIKLAISKYEKTNDEYNKYENEIKRINNINFKDELKLMYGEKTKRKIKSNLISKYEKERTFIYGIEKNRFKNLKNQFKFFKQDFNRNIQDLENKLENKLSLSYNKTNVNNIKADINKKIIKFLKGNTNIKKKLLLPSIKNKLQIKSLSSPQITAKTDNNFKKEKIKLKKVKFNNI